MHSRRKFLRSTSLGVAGISAAMVAPSPMWASVRGTKEPHSSFDGTLQKALIERALDSAKSSGAEYADVRLTYNRESLIKGVTRCTEAETISVGVRALVNRSWGFAASTVCTLDEMTRLGREASRQGQIVSRQEPGNVHLAPSAPIVNGSWIMPVEIDPFTIDPREIAIYFKGLEQYARNYVEYKGADLRKLEWEVGAYTQNKNFGSTEGNSFTQQTYRSYAKFVFEIEKRNKRSAGALDIFSPAGMGFELFLRHDVRGAIRAEIDDALLEMELPIKPIDIGRYDAVLDASSVCGLVSSTIGLATELDRILGFEANSGGTSYFKEPVEMLGTYQLGNPLLTVTGNRDQGGAVSTVKWDDEGVASSRFDIIKEGKLAGFAMGREDAGWLSASGARNTVNSTGCMLIGDEPTGILAGGGGINAPLVRTPNLIMAHSQTGGTFESLITDMNKGVAFKSLGLNMDFQQLNGLGVGRAYEVRNGKIVARYATAGTLFRAPEIWKSVAAVGGKDAVVRYGLGSRKGQPDQIAFHSVSAAPALFKELPIVDVLRRG